MNKKQREAIANRLCEIARQAGAIVDVCHGSKVAVFSADFPDVSVSVDINDLHKGGLMAHWYMAKRDLRMGTWFDSINECHKRKATLYRGNAEYFYTAFEYACDAVSSREAFA